MGKIVTSAKQKTASKRQKKMQKKELTLEDFEGIGKEHNPSDYLTNPENIGRAILECLENNDPEGVMEVIKIYLETVNKSNLAKGSHLARSTLYDSLKRKNPTVKTLAKIVSSSAG